MKRQRGTGKGKADRQDEEGSQRVRDEERERKRKGEKVRERLREAKRGSEILLIHRDRLRFRGNVVSIVTALLRMPLVGNKKRMPLTACMERAHTHTHTQ